MKKYGARGICSPGARREPKTSLAHEKIVYEYRAVQPDAQKDQRNAKDGLSPAASLVFLPSMSHDSPMMTRNAKMDACAKHGEDRFGDGVCAALRRVLVLAKVTRHAKKLLTASDIYLPMLLWKAHQARHRLHRELGVRSKTVAHHDDGWDGDGCVLGKFFDLPDYGIGIRKACA